LDTPLLTVLDGLDEAVFGEASADVPHRSCVEPGAVRDPGVERVGLLGAFVVEDVEEELACF
jgi:hypothetical protein